MRHKTLTSRPVTPFVRQRDEHDAITTHGWTSKTRKLPALSCASVDR